MKTETDVELEVLVNNVVECEIGEHPDPRAGHDNDGVRWKIVHACPCNGKEGSVFVCNGMHELLMTANKFKVEVKIGECSICKEQRAFYEVYRRSIPV